MIEQPRRRLRSAAAGLSAAGAAAMLSGCDAEPDQFGPPTEVAAFETVSQCVASGAFSQVQCEEAQATALSGNEQAAPRFEDRTTCEESHGDGACQQRFAGGQSFFSPFLTGFLIGQVLNGGSSRYGYQPLYRGRGGGYYLPSGAYLGNGNGYRYSVGSRAVAAPITTQRIQTRSSVVSRGGFGGRASSRGGWGGSRGG